jgi:O-antigen ligase
MLGASQEAHYSDTMLVRLFTLVQMLILCWISFNLLQDEDISKWTLLVFVGSCVLLALLQLSDVAARGFYERATVFKENANGFGSRQSLAVLALIGLAYGRRNPDMAIRRFAWICGGILAMSIVMTGSRGAMLSLVLGLSAFILQGGNWETKWRLGSLTLLGLTFLIWAVFTNEAVLERWEMAIVEGRLSNRENIFPVAWDMFLEKPLLGWGPVIHNFELGFRFSRSGLDPHNLYLWLLTEVGLLGAIPFFVGLWLALLAAWNARTGSEGPLPMAMLMCLLAINMSGTWYFHKLFWIVIAYALAAGHALASEKRSEFFQPYGPPSLSPMQPSPIRRK